MVPFCVRFINALEFDIRHYWGAVIDRHIAFFPPIHQQYSFFTARWRE